ncbi:MAG: hypothetical protein M3Y87_27840 [Myxococcota bacterium]|nr:hypothetical protein [Myxococcota bacterium]
MRSPEARTAAALAVVVLAGYTAVAWSVGSFYPFSVFPMYAGRSEGTRAGRLAARTASGELVEVTRFRAFDCEGTLEPERFEEACGVGPVYAPRYLDEELAHHVRAGASEVRDGEAIAIVRRIWTLAPDGSVSGDDCVLARCRASR